MNKTQTIQESVAPIEYTFGTPPARSCVVDNMSQSYLFIQDAGVYIPPLSARTVSLPVPSITVTVVWQTPSGLQAPTPGHGIATIVWSDQPSATTQPVTIYAQPPAAPLTTFQTTNGASVTTPPIPIPAGMQSVLVGYPIASAGPAAIFAQGVQSGRIFPTFATQSVAPLVSAFLFVIPAGGSDTSFTLTHRENDGAPQTVSVDGIFTPILQGVIAAQGFGAHSDGSWEVTVLGGPIGNVVVDIAQIQNPPLPVKLPGGLLSKRFWGSIAVGGAASLVAGVAGKIITVYSASLQLATGATGFQLAHMESDATSQPIVSSVFYNTAAPFSGVPAVQRWEGGMPLPAGEGIRLRTDPGSTVTTNHLGVVAYTGPS